MEANCLIMKEINSFSVAVFAGSNACHLVDNQQIGCHACSEVPRFAVESFVYKCQSDEPHFYEPGFRRTAI